MRVGLGRMLALVAVATLLAGCSRELPTAPDGPKPGNVECAGVGLDGSGRVGGDHH